MVKFYQKTHEYPEPTATPLLAFFLRYPNPFARHVLSVDVLSRSLDPVTGQLHTTRLILKRGIIPKWSHRFLPTTSSSGGRGLDAWVLEESVVDPPGWGESLDAPEDEREYRSQPKLQSQQGNLNHRKFMHIIEGGDLRAGPKGNTIHRTTAEVRSNLGGAWSNFMRQRIETYGVGKFEGNTETARKGMTLVMDLLRRRQPLPDTAEFYPPPPPQFGDRWPTTEEANASSSTIPKSSSSPTSFFLSRLVGIPDTDTGQTSSSPSNHSTTNNDNNDK